MKIIAGNFKSNLTRAQVTQYTTALEHSLDAKRTEHKIHIFPSHTALLENNFSHFSVGAQNAYFAPSGAFTGEVSLAQLQEFGIKSLIIGHSERRALFTENQEFIARKFRFYAEAGFEIFYCIGEDLKVRESGDLYEFLRTQFQGIDVDYPKLIVAYEPVWAIGTGVSATLEQIQSTHSLLSTLTPSPILYGGSVNAKNAQEILSLKGVDGVLVGSASLEVAQFLDIIHAL